MFDSGNRDIAIGQMTELRHVAAAPKINVGFTVVHLAHYWAEPFGHEGDFLERVTNHPNCPLGNIFVLRCQEVMKPFEAGDAANYSGRPPSSSNPRGTRLPPQWIGFLQPRFQPAGVN